MRRMVRSVMVAMIVCLAAARALAQSTGSGTAEAPKTNLDTMGGNLSDKLKATGGEIHPQEDLDPAMHKEAPPVGKTPVIRPPDQTGQGTGSLTKP